jgi:tetratricopeptide (TPR) repeat protein
VGWDDDVYLTDNPYLSLPFPAFARWALTATRAGLWQPLTWLSLGLDRALFGPEAWAHHLTNVLLHAATAVLLFFVLRELLRLALKRDEPWAAAAGALLFCLHPLRVESVAWAVERKDTLSGTLVLGGVLAWLRGRLGWALGLYAASLASKAAGVPLPLALLALEIYPRRRLPADVRRWGGAACRRPLLELACFAAVSAAATAATFAALSAWGEHRGIAQHPWPWRIGQALYGLFWYPLKTAWPADLLPYYQPRPWFGRLWPEGALLAAASAAAAAVVWSRRRKNPETAAAVFCYAVLVAPGLGLIQNAMPFSVCDRYSYLASLPWAALAAGAAAARGRASVGAALCLAAAFGVVSRSQVPRWRDGRTLWERAAKASAAPVALNNLGVAYGHERRLKEAVPLFRGAAAGLPGYFDAYENLGAALEMLGEPAEAESAYRSALGAKPGHAETERRLGALLAERRGGRAEAEALLRSASAKGAPRALGDLGALLAREGRTREAEEALRGAMERDPADGLAANDLGLLLESAGRRAQARSFLRLALRRESSRAEANYNLGNTYLSERPEKALARYDEALRLKPGLARARVNRGNILVRRGELPAAAAQYRLALKSEPGLMEARLNLSAVERALRSRSR